MGEDGSKPSPPAAESKGKGKAKNKAVSQPRGGVGIQRGRGKSAKRLKTVVGDLSGDEVIEKLCVAGVLHVWAWRGAKKYGIHRV